MKKFITLLLFSIPSVAQITPSGSDPSGPCVGFPGMQVNVNNGNLSACVRGIWGIINAGASSGLPACTNIVTTNCAINSNSSKNSIFPGSTSSGNSIVLPAATASAGTLQSFINSAGANSSLTLPAGYSETLTSQLTIPNNNVTLSISSGAVLNKGGNFDLISVTGNNIKIIGGGIIDGHSSSFTGNSILVNGASNIEISGITFQNSESGIRLTNATNVHIHHVSISGILTGSGIYGEFNTSTVDVHDNVVDRTAATTFGLAIGFHSTLSGDTINDVHIHDNLLYIGYSYCVEIGAFGGNSPTGISVINNNCTQKVSAAAYGGYSFDTTVGSKISLNHYINNVGLAPSLGYGVELVKSSGAIVSGNFLVGSTIAVTSTSDSVISGNMITNPYSACIGLSASYPSLNASNNIIDRNTCDNSSSTNTLKGSISFQCNSTGTIDMSSNSITNNIVLQNSGASGTTGIVLENDFSSTCNTSKTNVSGNIIKNAITGINGDYTNITLNPTLFDNTCVGCTNSYGTNFNFSSIRDTTYNTTLGINANSQLGWQVPGADFIGFNFSSDLSKLQLTPLYRDITIQPGTSVGPRNFLLNANQIQLLNYTGNGITVDSSGNTHVTGMTTVHVACYNGTQLSYCTSAVASDGTCTCH